MGAAWSIGVVGRLRCSQEVDNIERVDGSGRNLGVSRGSRRDGVAFSMPVPSYLTYLNPVLISNR